MYLAVKDYLTTHAAVVTPLPNYSVYSSAFHGAIVQIQTYGEQQRFDKSGLKAGKVQLINTLVMLTADNSRKILAYARYTNNSLLTSETKYSESDLKNATDNELRDIAQGVYDRAQSHLTALADYRINAETQALFLNTIHGYVEAIPKPRIGITEKKQNTRQLAEAFSMAEAALENLDGTIDIVKLVQPNFYNGYKSVRRLITTGRSKLAVKGLVTDLLSGEPLKKAILSFAADGNGLMAKSAIPGTTPGTLLVKKTAKKGGFIVKSLPAGSYNVTCSKSGYAGQTATLTVADGELSDLRMQLSKS
jgi:hypothetical protein